MEHWEHDLRSLDIHKYLANKLIKNPELYIKIKNLLDYWISISDGSVMPYRIQWMKLYDSGIENCIRVITSEDESSVALRQTSPFGALFDNPKERWKFMSDWKANHEKN